MQYGPRIVWGRGCPITLSGAHVIEFNEMGAAATCCQCALVLECGDLLRAFIALPVEAQRALNDERERQMVSAGRIEDIRQRSA